ncbi:MAG: hypothetical protein E7385_02675 [Ruminococcaceae bacterium]|nr:hypothetical protein [Oscillospiraceae bacterium]
MNDGCKWIWTPDGYEEKVNIYVHFKTSFTIEECATASAYTFKISADSQYALWINDRFVNYGQYADYPDYKVYDTLDVTDYIESGENKIYILAYHQGTSSSTYTTGRAGLLFKLINGTDIIVQSDSNVQCAVSTEYKNGPIEMVSGQLGYAFEYDATKIEDNVWCDAVVVGTPIRLTERPIQKLIIEDRAPATLIAQGVYKYDRATVNHVTAEKMQRAYMSARELGHIAPTAGPAPYAISPDSPLCVQASCDDGVYLIIDLGKETAGLFDILIQADRGTVVNIGYGQHLADLRVRTSVGGRCFTGKYICSGRGIEHFTHFNKRFGCRYIELMIESGEFDLYYAGVLPTVYPVTNVGRFVCSDTLHNKIHDISIDTLRLCMHEHYEDTPWREQALYSMDSRNQILCGYYTFGEYDMPRESLRLLAMGQNADGLLELCAPAKVSVTIPSFSLQWILELYEYVLYSGDLDFAYEMWPCAEKIIAAFWRNSRGRELVGSWSHNSRYWNFYEWAPGLDGNYMNDVRDKNNKENFDAPLSCFYMIALLRMIKLAKWLVSYTSDDIDFMEKSSWFEMLASGVYDSFDAAFWDSSKGVYATYIVNGERTDHYCQLANALALYAGLVPEEKISTVSNALAYDKSLIPVTLSASVFKYEALLMQGERFAQYVIDEIADKWGNMLYQGATSFWETEKGSWDFDNAGSLCHGWSAVPLIVYYKYILGVTPAERGFGDYKFKPLRTSLITAEGNIYRLKGKALHVNISPEGFEIQ